MVFPCFCQMPRAHLMWDVNSSASFSDIDNTNTAGKPVRSQHQSCKCSKDLFLVLLWGQGQAGKLLSITIFGVEFFFVCFVLFSLHWECSLSLFLRGFLFLSLIRTAPRLHLYSGSLCNFSEKTQLPRSWVSFGFGLILLLYIPYHLNGAKRF